MIPRLLGISPGDGRPMVDWIGVVGRAGLPGVLIREPTLDRERLEDAVRAAIDQVPFVAVHLRNPHAPEVAARFGVAVHASSADLLGPGLGVSAHDEARVDAALAAGAAYVLLSPVWSPSSKPADARPTLGPERFLAIAGGRPVLALGGVTEDRYGALRAAGAGAAILGPLTGSPSDISRRLRSFLQAASCPDRT